MSSNFYKSIIEDEMKSFGIKEELLKTSAKSVSMAYSRKSLNRGQTFLDYNIPSHRCAYLFKYASIHTGMVAKYFGKLVRLTEVKSSLKSKETFKIVCLGGGPGTDVVGLFKALSIFSQYHKKVVEVTILDICGGWRNSFKRIISDLIGGKVKDVSGSFVNVSNFKFKLIEVNLLYNLPSKIVTVISEADIVCMVKFVSAILGSSTSVSALQTIGEKLKVGAVVLFIDNFQGNVFKPFVDISGQIGLKIVLGPLHENFSPKSGFVRGTVTSKEKKMFGCLPLTGTKVTVLGFIKLDRACQNIFSNPDNISAKVMLENDDDNDDNWATDDESEISVKETPKHLPRKITSKKCVDKYTQTNEKHLKNSATPKRTVQSVSTHELHALVTRLQDLVSVLSLLKEQTRLRKNCCHCHCKV